MEILNNHNSRADWCCSEQDGEGLWWTASYPQEMWLQALAAMAENYATNPRVVGLDLRNELRRAQGHSPVWGSGGQYDWARAAETTGNLALDINPWPPRHRGGPGVRRDCRGSQGAASPGQAQLYPFCWDSTLPFTLSLIFVA